jgi:hypothetical protein
VAKKQEKVCSRQYVDHYAPSATKKKKLLSLRLAFLVTSLSGSAAPHCSLSNGGSTSTEQARRLGRNTSARLVPGRGAPDHLARPFYCILGLFIDADE